MVYCFFLSGNKIEQTMVNYLFFMPILIIVFSLTIGVIYLIRLGGKGIHNIQKCDDDLFDKIDQYKKCYDETNQNFIEQIQFINLLYQENGEVDELVKKKEIKRLLARADFLRVQNIVSDDFINFIISLVISLVASFIFMVMNYTNTILIMVLVVSIFFVFFMIFSSMYSKRGKMGEYGYFINEYEQELLLKKIKKLEQELVVHSDNINLLDTKRIVKSELLRVKKGAKKKEKNRIVQDIKYIENINLCVKTFDKWDKQRISINGQNGYLVYYRVENEKIMEKEFVELYNIIRRNNLLDD